MQVPEDYVLNMVKQTLDDKIDSIETILKNEMNGFRMMFNENTGGTE